MNQYSKFYIPKINRFFWVIFFVKPPVIPFLPWVVPPYVRNNVFPTGPCTGNDNRLGTCLTKAQCHKRGGMTSGSCSNKLGVCCVFLGTCKGASSSIVSYFSNIGYPRSYSGGSRCEFTVTKANNNICQMRLDFIDLRLSPPLYNGSCLNDFFSLGEPGLPRICGENSGLHAYVDFAPGCDSHKLTIDTIMSVPFQRKWSIKITQVRCNSIKRAPKGCLMFFTETSGTVWSFNFKPSAPPPVPNPTQGSTNQIIGLNYGICIRPGSEYCSIIWTQSADGPNTFTVSGDTDASSASISGDDCTHNFVVIPNPTNLPSNNDRFCGNSFPPVSTSSKPFVLTVVTRPCDNCDDNNNRGFKLDYRQISCI